MFSKIKGLDPPTGTISTSNYAGMNGSYLNNAFIEKRNVVIPFEMQGFEVYIAASPRNIEIFQTGRIVGRDDDKKYFGLIEYVELETDAEDGDYLIIKGRFLMCILERRIIYPTFNFTKLVSYSQIVMNVVQYNAYTVNIRKIPGLVVGCSSGSCWNAETKLQVSYDNLMEWVYTIFKK